MKKEEANKKIYEIGFLLLPTLNNDALKKTEEEIGEIIKKKAGEIIGQGERRDIELAYSMVQEASSQKERLDRAFFSWVKFIIPQENVSELKESVAQIENLLRFILIKTVRDNSLTDLFPKEKKELSEEELGEDLDGKLDEVLRRSPVGKKEDKEDKEDKEGKEGKEDKDKDKKEIQSDEDEAF